MPEDRRFRGTPASAPERGSNPDVIATALEAGERVRVTSGAFAGKSGVVAGHDPKGLVLVVLGQITVTLSSDEIELAPGEARGRTVLSSSHVKGAAGRSAGLGRSGGKKTR